MWSCFLYYVNLRINVYNSQWHGLCHSHWYLLVIMLLITCHNTWTELQPRCRCEFMRNIWECEWKWHVGKVVILYLSIIRLSHTQKTQWHASVSRPSDARARTSMTQVLWARQVSCDQCIGCAFRNPTNLHCYRLTPRKHLFDAEKAFTGHFQMMIVIKSDLQNKNIQVHAVNHRTRK